MREVIREVLPQAPGPPVAETVNLSTDDDLAAFVQRLLDLDPDQREELRSGRKRFRLAAPAVRRRHPRRQAGPAAPAATAAPAAAAPPPAVRRIERGAVTEAIVSGGRRPASGSCSAAAPC